MVQLQLWTLEHLTTSRFGRPFPRHGLQLLFWFANHCVTFELTDFEVIMKLVSDCQPEKGFCGFHLFGNFEELLPVLEKSRKQKSKRQAAYFEVGNLNTETYPASADLPTYVRENYGLDVNCGLNNIDRIIIGCQVRTRVVETVYVTEHDGASFGGFSRDRTYEISCELIRVLQSPQLDLATFLTQTGYYGDIKEIQANYIVDMYYPEPSAQQLFNVEPFSYDQDMHYIVNVASHNSNFAAQYNKVQHQYPRPRTINRPKPLRKMYWPTGWEQPYNSKGFDEAKKRNGGGGVSFFKILLGAGALYLAVKCFSLLRGWWTKDNILEIPWRAPSYRHTHIMLDYNY